MLLNNYPVNFQWCFLLQVNEIYNFNQDDLMTEDIFILDCHSDIYIWVGQQVEYKTKMQALAIGEVCIWLIFDP